MVGLRPATSRSQRPSAQWASTASSSAATAASRACSAATRSRAASSRQRSDGAVAARVVRLQGGGDLVQGHAQALQLAGQPDPRDGGSV